MSLSVGASRRECQNIDYNSRSTLNLGSDRGSIPLSSTTCGKEGPGLTGGFLITYADAVNAVFSVLTAFFVA